MSHPHEDEDIHIEPIPGLPEALPDDEHVLWQGRPDALGLANNAFHMRTVGFYFLALIAIRAAFPLADGAGLGAALDAGFGVLPFAAVCVGLLGLFGFLYARTSIYTITNKRLVIRFGLAITKAVNVPFALVNGASMAPLSGNKGNIALSVGGDERIGFLHLWPHVRPWRLKTPEPMLRAVADAPRVARLLADAVARAAEERGDAPIEIGAIPHNQETTAGGRTAGSAVPAGA